LATKTKGQQAIASTLRGFAMELDNKIAGVIGQTLNAGKPIEL
jgi:hypothetical protein